MVLGTLASWIITAISAAGYGGVLALMAIESACIPLPSEVIMPFAGYLASTGRFTLWAAALAGAVGCNVGSTIAYYVGAWGGRQAVERWGRFVLLEPADLDRAERFFHRFGGPAVFIARILPVVRTFIALPAGIARMRQLPFQIYTFVGSLGVVLRARLYRRPAGQALEQRPTPRRVSAPVRYRDRRPDRARHRLVRLVARARHPPVLNSCPSSRWAGCS